MKHIKDYVIELSDNGVFEIWYPGNGNDIFVPYMMNDALECYIVLKNASLVGEQNAELKSSTNAKIYEIEDGRYALVAKQSEENTFTVFFKDAVLEKKFYKFDGICHFWDEGQEHWGQLVYTIGTMYDKYAFLKEESCNDEEMYLLPLIEYAPFRSHAPAKKLFEELYDTTSKGTMRMISVALKAKDFTFAALNLLYLIIPCQWLMAKLSERLTCVRSYKLYNYLYNKTMEAASKYPERVYENDSLEHVRRNLDKNMKEKGYEGKYPDYSKNNKFIRVVEERPFTIMDWDDFVLKQRFMVSECEGKQKGFNMGFFAGSGSKGCIKGVNEYEII